MNVLERLFEAQLTIAGQPILWRAVIGNAFGFASAIGGMRRRVWAWPVGIVGNALLFTVFFGVAFANPQGETLYGQAGRQVFFIITSIYGWWRWSQIRRLRGRYAVDDDAGTAPVPRLLGRWCGGRAVAVLRDRCGVAGAAVVLLVRRLVLRRLHRRDLRHGSGLERLLAGLDRRGHRGGPAAGALGLLPLGRALRGVRRAGPLRL